MGLTKQLRWKEDLKNMASKMITLFLIHTTCTHRLNNLRRIKDGGLSFAPIPLKGPLTFRDSRFYVLNIKILIIVYIMFHLLFCY